ncbi:MAG: helix-turn-helix domain-containing protein [Bacteroidales bacterium]|nr:helix-turn-helix domain-containing protein [Bacteroidales bacterium]
MEKNIMDVSLLADYAGLSRWKVKKHLKPGRFARLKEDILQRYADIFEISLSELKNFEETLKNK